MVAVELHLTLVKQTNIFIILNSLAESQLFGTPYDINIYKKCILIAES